MERRVFIQLAAASAVMPALPGCTLSPKPNPSKKILVLGGTNYVGPAIVDAALAQGHEVTLFNRGITRPWLFPGIEKLKGERKVSGSDLGSLQGNRRWDVVIDVWPEQSALVKHTAELLADRTDYYYFCSTIGVYSDFSQVGINESSPVHTSTGWYGGEKAEAERLLAKLYPGRYGVSRCHAILGPLDNGVAFHYWLRRLALEKQVMAPGSGVDPVQYVDVRDVASWIVASAEAKRPGVYNLTGPQPETTYRQFLQAIYKGVASDASLVWVDADFLRQDQGVRSFTQVPLWAPLDEDVGFYQIDGSKALAAGLELRPLEETARDSWRWFRSHYFNNTQFPLTGWGMSREQEMEILAAWQERT